MVAMDFFAALNSYDFFNQYCSNLLKNPTVRGLMIFAQTALIFFAMCPKRYNGGAIDNTATECYITYTDFCFDCSLLLTIDNGSTTFLAHYGLASHMPTISLKCIYRVPFRILKLRGWNRLKVMLV